MFISEKSLENQKIIENALVKQFNKHYDKHFGREYFYSKCGQECVIFARTILHYVTNNNFDEYKNQNIEFNEIQNIFNILHNTTIKCELKYWTLW